MKKKILIIISIISILTITYFATTYIKANTISEIKFLKWKSYIATATGETLRLDFPYVFHKGQKDKLKENIERVEIKDVENIDIQDMTFLDGSDTPKYTIRTLSLEVKLNKVLLKNFNTINIYYKDNKQDTFNVGEWVLDVVDKGKVGDHIESGNHISIGSSFDKYQLSIINKTSTEVTLKELQLDIPETARIDLPEKYKLSSNENFIKDLNFKKPYSGLYCIKPRLVYTYKNKDYYFHPFMVKYGLINLDDKKLEAAIKGD